MSPERVGRSRLRQPFEVAGGKQAVSASRSSLTTTASSYAVLRNVHLKPRICYRRFVVSVEMLGELLTRTVRSTYGALLVASRSMRGSDASPLPPLAPHLSRHDQTFSTLSACTNGNEFEAVHANKDLSPAVRRSTAVL